MLFVRTRPFVHHPSYTDHKQFSGKHSHHCKCALAIASISMYCSLSQANLPCSGDDGEDMD